MSSTDTRGLIFAHFVQMTDVVMDEPLHSRTVS